MSIVQPDTPTLIECVRNFIAECPLLDEYARLMVDRLESDVSSYSIDTVPCTPIIRSYINGDTVRQYEFHFSSTEAYTQEVLDAITNSTFYERFAGWLESCTRERNLPDLGEGKTAQTIAALTSGYMADADAVTARYVIQCRLTYLQKSKRRLNHA